LHFNSPETAVGGGAMVVEFYLNIIIYLLLFLENEKRKSENMSPFQNSV